MIRILIVDDNHQNLYMAEVLFTRNGYHVETAENGKVALEKARKNPPDIILSDILMPVMDGFSLCREWKADEKLKNIPFIFYTATYTENEDKDFALSLGADCFIVKPLAPDELIRITGKVLNDVKTRRSDRLPEPHPNEEVFLRRYNQALIHKLEDKLIQLEEEIKGRKYAEEKLSHIEKQLFQIQKMEALGTLAGGIAHDFNNILMAIMGHAEIALLSCQGGTPSGNDIELVLRACNRATELVSQILTFSRQTDMDRKPLHASIIIKEILKLMRSSLPKNIEIKQKIESDAVIVANPTQIYQVLMNLCTNASHAMMGQNGTIEVRLSETHIDGSLNPSSTEVDAGPYQKLEVIDNGSGIKKENLDHIFNPYFTTKKETGGSGLGLSLVQNIVRGSGGFISVESEYGKGTAFTIYFPVFQGDWGRENEDSAIKAGGSERILFVDDDPTFIEIGVELLKKLGYRVAAFKESQMALQAFKEKSADFDLVISDINMPGLSGINLSKELLKIRTDIPVILCTGFGDEIIDRKVEELGVKAVLMKPLVVGALSRTIREVLDPKIRTDSNMMTF